MNSIPTLAPYIAVAVSLLTLIWVTWSWKKVEFRIRAHENTKLMIAAESKLADLPNALRLHGINTDQIIKCGLTLQEFVYLISNFSAGQSFYEFERLDPKHPFTGDNYRAILCRSPEVIAAWPYIRQFMDDTHYKTKLDLTVKLNSNPKSN